MMRECSDCKFNSLTCEDEPCKQCCKPGADYWQPIESIALQPATPYIDPKYASLYDVLMDAYNQAAEGKGKDRHADGEPFEKQKICEIARRVGLGYPLGQAIKKAIEAQRLGGERGVAELLGAINYLAATVIIIREKE